jgi:hypothetical protein
MSRDRHELRQVGLHRLSPVAADPDLRPEQRLGRSRAKEHDRARRDDRELGAQPWKACVHLPTIGLLVDPPLSPCLEAEVLDHVGDVGVAWGDPGLIETLVEDPARRADERVAFDVLAVAGLLADQHQRRRLRAFAHYRLRGPLMEVAGSTCLDRAA